MAEEKEVKTAKAKKMADPIAASIDPATQEMIARAQELGVETIFDRAVTMKACNIGAQGTCCKNCSMGRAVGDGRCARPRHRVRARSAEPRRGRS